MFPKRPILAPAAMMVKGVKWAVSEAKDGVANVSGGNVALPVVSRSRDELFLS